MKGLMSYVPLVVMLPLEVRWMLASVYPTANEQLMVELITARANPAAEAARLGIDLNEGLTAGTISTAAKQPLAINPNLTDGRAAQPVDDRHRHLQPHRPGRHRSRPAHDQRRLLVHRQLHLGREHRLGRQHRLDQRNHRDRDRRRRPVRRHRHRAVAAIASIS